MGVILGLLSSIDWLLYQLASLSFTLIFDLANYKFFDENVFGDFANRIYIILGVLMLFKVIISFIQMLINPEKTNDKENGLGGLLKRTIITVALLAIVPSIFSFASSLQEPISKMIPKLILNNSTSEDNLSTIGSKMAYQVWITFVEVKDGKGGSIAGKYVEGELAKTGEINSIDTLYAKVNESCGVFDCNNNKYNYQLIFPTIAGGFLVYVLISMALDIAIRVFKFGVLQLLSPIAIASYIDPKTAKSTFDVWIKNSIKVYCDLFVRLIVVYLIIFVFDTVLSGTSLASIYKYFESRPLGNTRATFVLLFIVVGLLMFAKKAPGFIMDTLGIKQNDEIKDMFKPAWKRAGALGALAGVGASAVGNIVNRVRGIKHNDDWKNKTRGQKLKEALKVAGSGIAGATSAGLHGGMAAIQGKNSSEVLKAGHARAVKARQNREIDKINHVEASDRLRARTNEFFGLDTEASLAEGKQKAYSVSHQDTGNFKKAVMGRIVKEVDVAMPVSTNSTGAMSQLGQLLATNASVINTSNNQDLINYMNRFERTVNSEGKQYYKLKDGCSLSYHDIAAINTDAVQAGIGSVANLTGENGALTLQAQKELFTASMRGQIRRASDGSLLNELNVGNENTHVDIRTAVGQAQQHITENALNLGTIELKDGRKISGAREIKEEFMHNFGGLDDAIQKQSAVLSENISTNPEAAARASIQRRADNKKDK